MKIAYTRAMVNAALDGTLAKGEFRTDPNFGFLVPASCVGVPADVLQPKATWPDKTAYDAAAQDVARRFEKNFEQFDGHVDTKVKAAAIKAAA
jgi:phosphoenolpyruvate carboxykinase (ATP)